MNQKNKKKKQGTKNVRLVCKTCQYDNRYGRQVFMDVEEWPNDGDRNTHMHSLRTSIKDQQNEYRRRYDSVWNMIRRVLCRHHRLQRPKKW